MARQDGVSIHIKELFGDPEAIEEAISMVTGTVMRMDEEVVIERVML